MKNNFPISSQEIKNILLEAYENTVYLLGIKTDNYDHFSGLYEYIDASGETLLASQSGILSEYSTKIKDILKFDYIYRKHFGQITYEEKK